MLIKQNPEPNWWQNPVLVGIILSGLAARLVLAFAPLDFILDFTLPDDAFYYFVIVRNLVLGQGVTFDGVNPANGFHPLWVLMLAPWFKAALCCSIFPGEAADVALRGALVLGAGLDVLAATGFALLAERWQKGSGAVVALLYLFNLRLAMEAVNGLETALAMLVLAGYIWAMDWLVQTWTWRSWAAAGALGGLAFLARTDLAILVLFVSLGVFVVSLRRTRSLDWGWLVYALVGLLVVAPWFAWSRLATGHWTQSSAVAMPLLVQYRFSLGGNLWQDFQLPVINYAVRALLIYGGAALLAGLGVLLLARLGRVSRRVKRWLAHMAPRDSHLSAAPVYLAWLALAGVAVGLGVHTLVRWYPRGWYYAPWAGLLALVVGLGLAHLLAKLGRQGWLGLAGALLVLLVFQVQRTFSEPVYPGQVDWIQASDWVRSSTPPDAVIGAFNSGILGYFAERRVINLDGVVDWNAIAARQENRLLAYLRQQGGTYLVDREEMIWNSFSPFLGPEAENLVLYVEFIDDFPAGETTPVHGRLVLYLLPISEP